MSDENNNKKNGRFHIGTAVILVGIIGGPLAVWGESQLERGETRQKINQLEKRAAEDRRAVRESLSEQNAQIRNIDQATQLILQEVRAMKAVQEAERRGRQR